MVAKLSPFYLMPKMTLTLFYILKVVLCVCVFKSHQCMGLLFRRSKGKKDQLFLLKADYGPLLKLHIIVTWH